ncbi:histone acetyltransferase HAC1-like protein isoform X3, partial [Tanacetum coccineum]
MHLQFTVTWCWHLKIRKHRLSFNDNEKESGPGHIKIQSVSSVDCEMVSESESIEAQTTCFDDNSLGSGSGNMKIPSVSSVDCEMVSEFENTEVQTACFDDISSRSGSGNIKIPSVSSVDCGMVSESKKTKVQVACLDDNSSGSGSENMKIPSVSSVDCDMVSESKKTKIQVACSEDKSSGSRSGNMKIPSVSLADFITASQIKQHLSSFNPDNRYNDLVTAFEAGGERRINAINLKETELQETLVAEAEGLVVRVVLFVDKELERLGGVDVCIFGMYVQEYGSECSGPDNSCVYIHTSISSSTFNPKEKTQVIGYLEHFKKRGFSTCYIWLCPVVKGQDYIFNYRPKTQKTQKEDKLLKWYKLMLTKAAKEGIVCLLVGAAETISKKLEEEESSGKLSIKLPNKRTLKAVGQDNPTKDVLVMQQLGDKIMANKENLMIVHLQQTCTSCHEEMLCGSRWDILSDVPRDTTDRDGLLINNFFETRDDFLNNCPNLHVCESCNETKGDTCHYHKLTHPSTEVTLEITKNKEPEKQKVTVDALLDALVHASR